MTDFETKYLRENRICKLQQIRRANNGMRGCAEILIQHSVNKESVNTSPGANVVLTVQQEAGLHYVIEACADMIDRLFYDLEDELEIQWTEEHMPEVRKEAESAGAFQRGEISFEQFEKESGVDPSFNN